MSPLSQAMQVYEREVCARPFWEDYQAHLITGHVFHTEHFFCMGRAVQRGADEDALLNPWTAFDEDDPATDAWLVWLVAGDMAKAWECFPSVKPWIGFQRKNRLRWRVFGRMEAGVKGDRGQESRGVKAMRERSQSVARLYEPGGVGLELLTAVIAQELFPWDEDLREE